MPIAVTSSRRHHKFLIYLTSSTSQVPVLVQRHSTFFRWCPPPRRGRLHLEARAVSGVNSACSGTGEQPAATPVWGRRGVSVSMLALGRILRLVCECACVRWLRQLKSSQPKAAVDAPQLGDAGKPWTQCMPLALVPRASLLPHRFWETTAGKSSTTHAPQSVSQTVQRCQTSQVMAGPHSPGAIRRWHTPLLSFHSHPLPLHHPGPLLFFAFHPSFLSLPCNK